MDHSASNNDCNFNCDSGEKETSLKKKTLVLAFVLTVLFSQPAGLLGVKANSQTNYPLSSGINITSPANMTYTSSLLTLNVSVNALVASNIRISMIYSLDGMNNNTIPLIAHSRENSFQARITGAVTLPTLSYGSHNLTVFMEHIINNELAHSDNQIVYFTFSTNSEQEIPEFPSGTILPILISSALVFLMFRNKLGKRE